MRRLAPLSLIVLLGCGGAAMPATTTMPVAPPRATHFEPATITAVHGAFVASLPTPVTSFGAAVIDGTICVAGGYHGTPHDYDREGQSRELACLDAAGTWHPHAAMETGLQGFAMVATGDRLVRCGGSRIDNAPDAPTDMRSITTCAEWSAATDAWAPFPDLPAPRSSFDAAVLDGRLYAVGGWNVEGDQDHARFVDTMLVYDPARHAWSTEASPVHRRALAVVATAHALVAVGGLGDGLAISTSVDVYDPATHAWSTGPAFPGDGFGMAAAAVGDTVYASGSDGMIFRWTVGETAWTPFHALAQPRFFHRLVVVGTDLYAVGGIGAMTMDGRAALIERISTLDAAPAEAVGWVEMSFPGHARNRAAVLATDDSLYVLGGNDSPGQHDFAPTNFVTEAFRLHVPSLRWYVLPPLPEGRQSMEVVPLGDRAIALGGFGHDGHAARTFADGFVLGQDETITLARDVLPAGRTQFGAAVWGDAVWIFAGLVFDESLPEEQQFTHLDDVLRCPVTNGVMGACETIEAHLPGTRRAFGSARSGDRFYIVGGMRDGFAPVDDCFVFDFTTRSFSPFTCPAHVRISATMIAHGDRLVLAGGSSGGPGGLAADRSIEVFDPGTGAWATAIAALPFETHQGRWAFVGDRLVMLSTQAEAGQASLAMIALPQ